MFAVHQFLVFLFMLLSSAAAAAEQPGPSAALLAHPVYSGGIGLLYTCVTNFYVNSNTGNDGNSGGQSSPWATIQHADSITLQPGTCINVAAGTYTWTQSFTPIHGGNNASPTGYVVYRCEVLDQCFIVFDGTYMGSNGQWVFGFTNPYYIIDGFDVDGGEAFMYGGIATACFDSSLPDTRVPSHHIWILNNNIHGCNIAGIGLSDSEYYFAIHNNVYDNAFTDPFQGSGIGYVTLKALGDNLNPYPPYTPTVYDQAFAPIHNIVSWNRVFNNGCTICLGFVASFTTTANTNGSTTISGLASVGTSASFTATTTQGAIPTISVSGITGTITPGDQVSGTGVGQSSFILAYGTGGTTGTGGNGTYALSTVAGSVGPEAMTSATLGESVLVTGPGIQPFSYITGPASGNSVTITRPALTSQSGGTFIFYMPGNGHTDGNGIIMDTWCGTACGGSGTDPYNYADKQTLISFNDVQFNGGRGIHNFAVYNTVVINNSMYHDGLDLFLGGSIGELSQSGGTNNRWYNNNALAANNLVTSCNFTGVTCNYCLVAGNGRGQTDLDTQWFNNITGGGGIGGQCVALFDNDVMYWQPANNKGAVNPLYVDGTSLTSGDLHLQFPASPAINYVFGAAFPFLPSHTTDAGAYQTGGIRTTNFFAGTPNFAGEIGFLTQRTIQPSLTCAEATAFLARVSAPRAATSAYSNLICRLVNAGMWCGQKLDILYVFATYSQAAAELNLCSETNYVPILHGSPAWAVNQGFLGVDQSTSVFIDTQFNQSTAVGPLYSSNAAHLSVWINNDFLSNDTGGFIAGSVGSFSGVTFIQPYATPNGGINKNFIGQVNNLNQTFAFTPQNTSLGFFFLQRDSSAGGEGYFNNSLVFSFTQAELNTNNNIYLLAINNAGAPGGGGRYRLSVFSLGTSFLPTEEAEFCFIINAYMTEIGSSPAGLCPAP